jgi:adenosylcobalamin-dependent ribonucleoside-triphosphate reductase
MDYDFSSRALAVDVRTYRRFINGELETFDKSMYRAQFAHHQRLAEEAGKRIDPCELWELLSLGLNRQSWVAGRTRWLGGTDYAFSRPCCQFNCAFTEIASVYDFVDAAWLLLNGCGVGFRPVVGTLRGFERRLAVNYVPGSDDPAYRGNPENQETVSDGVWTIRVGDSAQAWAKALGKLLAPPSGVTSLTLDMSNVRGPGGRLAGYGWVCNGWKPLLDSMVTITGILNRKAGNLLDEIDIGDCVNLVGSTLSSRRSAQIWLLDSLNPRIREFMSAKKDYWHENPHRRQSNNTVQYWVEPSEGELRELLYYADATGGDPGIENATAARIKCPWFSGSNPCHEILLPRNGFCNVVTNCLPRLRRDFAAMERAVYLIARANYRQTCVNLRDGILSPAWDQTNQSLRLCGVSLTGIVQTDWLTDFQIRRLRNAAVCGAYSQADDWDVPRPQAVTTIKPEGTGSKAMGSPLTEVTEGIHRPIGQHLFNWINFSVHDPLVPRLESAGYKTLLNPSDGNNVLVCFPVEYKNVGLTHHEGKYVNLEPAVDQLNRYLRWNNLWADHTVSATISYDPDEIPAIAKWVKEHWHRGYIATAFLRRTDPTKTARDLGHPYLPQEVVTEGVYLDYLSTLRPYGVEGLTDEFTVDEPGCQGGVCPTR